MGNGRMKILDLSHLNTKSGLTYFEIPEIAKFGWTRHGFLTRKGGVSHLPYDSLNVGENNGDRKEDVYRNRDHITSTFGFTRKRLILLKQMQTDGILLIKDPVLTIPPLLEYDAVITDASNIFLGIKTADCIPILILDPKKKVIAAVHAGRQGTALNITMKVIKKLEGEFGCSLKSLLVAIGPSIGSCCYEIDEKVFHPEWNPFSISVKNGKWMVDLAQINIAQMKREGINEEQISWINLCTRCHSDLFFSYRREGQTGRQLSFIGITKQPI
jgi:YfiH family protein